MQGDHLHLLKAGEVRVLWREGPGCPSYELATLLQGELIGALGENDEGCASEFTLQTVRPSELYSVSRNEFLARFKPDVVKNTRDLLRAKSDTWRQRAQAKRLTEPKMGAVSTASTPRVGRIQPLERSVSARHMARTRRYSVGDLDLHKRSLDGVKERPPSMARLAMPAPPAGGLANLSISSSDGPESVGALNSARAQRRVTLPHAMPSSWQRHELTSSPLGFQ